MMLINKRFLAMRTHQAGLLVMFLVSCLVGACQEPPHWPEETGVETTPRIEKAVQSAEATNPTASAEQMKKSAAALIATFSAEDLEKAMFAILIEYIRERGVGGDQGAANHIHSIVRDPSNDYGEDWLELHYQEHHSERPRR